jgi:hypothetical protein
MCGPQIPQPNSSPTPTDSFLPFTHQQYLLMLDNVAHAVGNITIHLRDLSYIQLLKGLHDDCWLESTTEIGRITQAVLARMRNGTDNMNFILNSAFTAGLKATYLLLCIIAESLPKKLVNMHVRFTVGGDRVNYPSKASTPTADLITIKMLFNSAVSTPV